MTLSDSACILNWQPPSADIFVFKKLDLQTCVNNLKEIGDFVLGQYDSKTVQHRDDLLQNLKQNLTSAENHDLNKQFLESSSVWETLIKDWLTQTQKNPGEYLSPLRTALSGAKQSPSPFEILSIIDKNETKLRIDITIKQFQNQDE